MTENETTETTVQKSGGRNPVEDKKIQVQFYIETSKVEACGGMEASRDICRSAMERRVKIKKSQKKKK